MALRPILLAIVLLACKSKSSTTPHDAATNTRRDAAVSTDAPPAIDILGDYPRIDAVRTITLPGIATVGPVIAGDLAIVGGEFGFAAVDYQRGGIAWTKPAGKRVAPPLVHGSSIVLVGECARYEPVPDGETLLGCLRVVTTTGSDQAFLAIHGRGVDAFAAADGAHALWDAGERAVRWRRGTQAVTVDLLSGVAKAASAEAPPLAVTYRGKRWEIAQRDGRVVASGKQPWRTEHPYTSLVGIVWTADMAPLVRVVNVRAMAGDSELHVIDMDATGSLRATVARPTPGVALRGYGVSARGDAALVVRMRDGRDVIAAYAANALLVYVHVLPRVRGEVGVAVAEDAVVVIHDDQLGVLPELSAPPTSPGATRGSSKNPTP
ncbi:MAG: hypothetical protein M4D80_19040 [Myxococcota bacterium]|nr:hypothetical protein [Myxococcota bacterium]